jgi:hypothetical protein
MRRARIRLWGMMEMVGEVGLFLSEWLLSPLRPSHRLSCGFCICVRVSHVHFRYGLRLLFLVSLPSTRRYLVTKKLVAYIYNQIPTPQLL